MPILIVLIATLSCLNALPARSETVSPAEFENLRRLDGWLPWYPYRAKTPDQLRMIQLAERKIIPHCVIADFEGDGWQELTYSDSAHVLVRGLNGGAARILMQYSLPAAFRNTAPCVALSGGTTWTTTPSLT